MGHISNQKPSAIFKISQLKKLHELESPSPSVFGSMPISHSAQIGVSIEFESNLVQQTSAVVRVAEVSLNHFSSPESLLQPSAPVYYQFGQKMLQNFYNFVSSFAVTQSQMTSNPSETFVPLSTLTTWFQNFERRLEQNPNFWK